MTENGGGQTPDSAGVGFTVTLPKPVPHSTYPICDYRNLIFVFWVEINLVHFLGLGSGGS